MCTVTYLPLEKGCIITSNRDETIARAKAAPPASFAHGGKSLIYPKDPVGGGTWIATSETASVCLFNGAFEAHKHNPPYRHSRGLIPINVLMEDSLETFVRSFDLDNIEPFSIVVYQREALQELKWDGQKSHLIEHDARLPHIWASATLYSPEVRNQRKRWFQEWLDTAPDFTREHIVQFHTQQQNDHENGLLIRRKNGLQTVSVTSIGYKEERPPEVFYKDLLI